jgi:exosortase/archaeosortase family protein
MVNGRGIILGYECVGYGVMSFWAAFVGASVSSFPKKIMWLFIGFIALWVLNIVRLALLLLATNKGWPVPFGWDHHTWFNILAYIFIFTMIYLFHKNSNGPEAGAIGDKHV